MSEQIQKPPSPIDRTSYPDYRICIALLDTLDIAQLSKISEIEQSGVIDILGAMFARAFGPKFAGNFKRRENFPFPEIYHSYCDWSRIIQAVGEMVVQQKPIEESPYLQERARIIPLIAASHVATYWETWKTIGISSQPSPLYMGVSSDLYPIALRAEQSINEMAETLFIFFDEDAEDLEGLPYRLLPLLNSCAFFTPSGSVSWYELVVNYGKYVPTPELKPRHLLNLFPFIGLLRI